MKKIIATVLAAAALVLCPSCALGGTAGTNGTFAPETNAPEVSGDRIVFTTESVDGETVRSSDFKDAKLIMINFFEPWCGPCVGEMPDLEKLRADYGDRGLVILGVFYSEGMDDEVRSVISETGVTYPILRGCAELDAQTSDYVPTTFFMDGEGRVVGEQLIGARDYESWRVIVEGLLG